MLSGRKGRKKGNKGIRIQLYDQNTKQTLSLTYKGMDLRSLRNYIRLYLGLLSQVDEERTG